MKKLFTLIGFIQLAILNPVLTQIPGTINVQGVLTNANGQIFANGNYSITFRLYASAQDATILWEEKQDNLSVQAGVFSANLGKIKPFTVPFDKTYFLGLQIGQEAELAPRIEMTSTPYSMMAKSVENNAVTTGKIQNNAVTLDKIAPPIISSINGVVNDGGDIKLKAGKNIEVTADQNDKSLSISVSGLDSVANDTRYVNENQTNVIGQTMIKDNAVSVEKIIPNVVSSINNVNNDGGNINIVAGANITILNNDQENTITISAVNPGNTNPGIGKINAGKGIAVAGTDGPTAVISVSPNSLTDLEVADKSLSAISLANEAVGNTEIQPNAVTVDKIAPNVVSSLSGVSNDGGNINLVAGNNVTIVPNDVNKTITISASGPGGGTSNFTQLQEGSNIAIQNQLGPIPVIGLKPNVRLGPEGSLDILNESGLSVIALDDNNNSGGYMELRNQEGTEVFRVTTTENRQPLLRMSNRLGNQVAALLANDFSDGELNLSSVLRNPTVQITANDNAGGLINIFNPVGVIGVRLYTNSANDGRISLFSAANRNVFNLGTNTGGGGFASIYNELGNESVRLTTTDDLGGQVNVYNRFGNLGVYATANGLGDGGLFINSGENLPIIDLQANNNNGSGFFGLYNSDGNGVIEMSAYDDRQPYLKLFNRLDSKIAELSANEFSDGELTLGSVLENITIRLTANANAGGLINVFNPAGNAAAVLTDDGGGYLGIFNPDETEMIQLSILPDRNARVRVNNRLGNPAADLISNEFSDGQLTLFSVLENPTVLLGANDNAGGLVTVLNKGGTPSAVMTEIDGYGGVGVFSPTQSPLASMHGSTTTGFGAFTVYHNNENSIMAQMTRDANENGALGIFNRYQFPIVRLGGNNNSDGQIGIFDVAGLRMAELVRDSISMGGKLSVFNKDSRRAANLLAGFNGSGLLQLYNNLNNLSAGFLADDKGGKLFIGDGGPFQSPRVDLSTTPDGSQLLLYSNTTNLIHSLTVKPTGEGLFELKSKKNYPKNAVEFGGDDVSAGYLKISSSLGMNTSFLGNDLFNDGTLELRNNAGNIGGYFTAFRDGGSLVVTDGNPGINHRAALEAGLNGGRMAIYNKDIKLVGDMGVANNGEAWLRIISKQDLSKNRMELGGDDAGAGYSRFYNNSAQKTADIGAMADASGFMSTYSAGGKRQTLISSANNGGGLSIFNSSDKIIGSLITASNQGGEMNIYNVNGANTSKLSNGGSGAGMLEIGTSAGDKVARVTTLDGTGYIGLDNVDKKEVVRITANLGKGGGIGLKNAALFDMINLTQDNNFGAILLNNATGGLMTNITHNTAGGAFIGTKDQNGKDAVWLTTGITGGGHFNTFNSLGNAALTLNSNASNIGNVSVHGTAGNEIARVSGTSNGIGFVGIFNSGGFGLAGLTSNNTTLGGYIYAQTAAGKDVARMTTTSAGGGAIAINSPVGTAAVSYLTYNNQNGGYIGVANSAGNDRARITTNTGGSGIMSVSNASGSDVVEATVSAANHGTVATYNASGANIAGLLATTTGHGYIRAGNTSGNERASMSSGDLGGRVDVSDPNGNVRVVMSAGGNMTVNDVDGSYLSNYSTGSGVNFIMVDKFQHPRAEIKNGIVLAKGPNGIEHSFMSTTNGSNLGYIGVCNSNIVNSPVKAGMYTNNNNQGVLFADIKNFKIDYPGKPDKQIWYGSLEGPELAAYIRGTGKLVSGKASIEFTDHYQKLANTSTMTVILTPLSGKSKGLAVVKKAGTGFEVEELLEGSGSYEFDWEVKCVRKGHEGFEVVRNKSDDPKPFTGADLPVSLPDRSGKDIQVDQFIQEKTVKQ